MIEMRLVAGAPKSDLQVVLEIAYAQQCENNILIEIYGFLPFVLVPPLDVAMIIGGYDEKEEPRTATGYVPMVTASRRCGVCCRVKTEHTSKQANECFNRFIEGIN